ncbi:MAG TPA: ATP-binding protein, partial [Terriglobales bacterium]|nr:ATP-binding protein [Terriglobales bacterium]
MPQGINLVSNGLFDICQHVALLGILCLLIGWWRVTLDSGHRAKRIAGWSIVLGLMALISMLAPLEPLPGLRIDIRAAVIALGLLFGGWPVAVIVTALEAVVRLYLDGPMMAVGTSGIVAAGIAVLLTAWALRIQGESADWRWLIVLGVAAGCAGPLASFLFFPPATAWHLVVSGGPANIVGSALGLLILASIIHYTDAAQRSLQALREREALLLDTNQQLTELTVRLERRNQDYQQALDNAEALRSEIQTIFDHAPIGIYVKDLDSRYITLNKPAAAAISQPVEKLLGQVSTDFLHPDDAARALETDREVISSGREVACEFEAQTAGAPRWIWSVKFPIRDADHKITAIGGFDIDISERKRQEQVLQRTALQLRRVQQISRFHSWYNEIDEEGVPRRLPGLSDNFFAMTGWHAEDVLRDGHYVDRCVHPIDRERIREIHRAFRDREIDTYTCEYNLICADGRVLPVKVWVERQPVAGGRVILGECGALVTGYFVGVMQDISEQRERERQLLDAKSRAEMAGRVKSDFLANLSHELRTPLNAIIGFSDLLKMTLAGNGRALDYLDAVNQSGQHLLGIINSMLEIAQLDFGARALSEQVVDVGGLLQTAMDDAERRHRDTSLSFVVAGVDDGIGLFAEAAYLRQALDNLIANAVKFTGLGGEIRGEINVLPDGNLELAIRDTGCGIAADVVPRLASPFVYAGNVYARRHGGMGLGLAMCRKILELHGGRLAIESRLGRFTRVALVFPSARVIAREPVSSPARLQT